METRDSKHGLHGWKNSFVTECQNHLTEPLVKAQLPSDLNPGDWTTIGTVRANDARCFISLIQAPPSTRNDFTAHAGHDLRSKLRTP